MTWDEAKAFIICKHDMDFWKSWVNRVEWRELTAMEVKLMKQVKEQNTKIKELEEKVAAQDEKDDLMDVCAKNGAC